ncbi:natterin-3-like [Nerophis ophidion]|uniref:natterin-3-like n=1 Tax=Nerophis ophidion TaxID=159077 RepID=UPI002ADF334D|nr:natterin-3-like [Nerophis ophidion]
MKPSVLLLLLALTLALQPDCEDQDPSSTDLPGTFVGKYSKCALSMFSTWLAQLAPRNDSPPSLNPALKNHHPEVPPATKPLRFPPPVMRLTADSDSFNFDESNLEWRTTYETVFEGSVSIYNSYAKRVDYICKVDCNAGYYNPESGSACVFSKNGYGYSQSPFELLVNKDNFEILQWKQGSKGFVTPFSVKTCQNEDIYVGKNMYGLGKVKVSDKVFYLAWGSTEYWYPDYQFLEVKKDVRKEHLMKMTYHTEGITPVVYPPEILHKDTVSNYHCQPIKRTSTLSKSISTASKWDTAFSFSAGVGTTIQTGIPFIIEGKIQFRASVSYKLVKGTTHTEITTHSLSVDTTVQAGYSCTITMRGKKYGLDIPYTARLKRTYSDGETTWTSVTGTYRSIQISEIQAVVDRCERMPNFKPC